MTIGINASAAIKQPRTGVEEYCYQVIKHLTMLPETKEHRFLLYLPAVAHREKAGVPVSDPNPSADGQIHPNDQNKLFDFILPENFEVKKLNWPLPMWTQIRFAGQMLFNKPDVLFIPVHISPRFHPKNSIVTIHGLEYEYFPEYYPFWFRNYLRQSTKYAVKHARKIIAVSENTKNDLLQLHGADPRKIEVVYHGVNFPIQNSKVKNQNDKSKLKIDKPFLLYIGRIEIKKNIIGILEAYKILKEKYKIPHELILAGAPGFRYEKIKFKVQSSKFKVIETGYVSEDDKWKLLRRADVFLFPSFYEGFGMPILEAQAAGVPVVTSNVSSIPEVAGDSAALVNPNNPEQIAQAVYKFIDDKILRDKLIGLGYENVKRFSWEKCVTQTLNVLLE